MYNYCISLGLLLHFGGILLVYVQLQLVQSFFLHLVTDLQDKNDIVQFMLHCHSFVIIETVECNNTTDITERDYYMWLLWLGVHDAWTTMCSVNPQNVNKYYIWVWKFSWLTWTAKLYISKQILFNHTKCIHNFFYLNIFRCMHSCN